MIVPDWKSSVSVNMSMYLYNTSTYWYVLVYAKRCWKVERRHTSDFGLKEVILPVLNEFMVVPKH